MLRRTIRVLSLAMLAVLSGCASTPPSQFYTLAAVPVPGAPASGAVVVVGPVSVPAAVDRPQIVVTVAPNQVRLDEFNRWASPLQDEIAGAVAMDLVAALGTPNVTTLSADDVQGAQYRVSIDVQRFECVPGSSAAFDAAWVVRRVKDDSSASGRTNVREPVQQDGYGALAAAHSRAVGQLATEIAAAITSFEAAAK